MINNEIINKIYINLLKYGHQIQIQKAKENNIYKIYIVKKIIDYEVINKNAFLLSNKNSKISKLVSLISKSNTFARSIEWPVITKGIHNGHIKIIKEYTKKYILSTFVKFL